MTFHRCSRVLTLGQLWERVSLLLIEVALYAVRRWKFPFERRTEALGVFMCAGRLEGMSEVGIDHWCHWIGLWLGLCSFNRVAMDVGHWKAIEHLGIAAS